MYFSKIQVRHPANQHEGRPLCILLDTHAQRVSTSTSTIITRCSYSQTHTITSSRSAHLKHRFIMSLTIVPQLSIVLSAGHQGCGRPGRLRKAASDRGTGCDKRACGRGGGENANDSGGELHDDRLSCLILLRGSTCVCEVWVCELGNYEQQHADGRMDYGGTGSTNVSGSSKSNI